MCAFAMKEMLVCVSMWSIDNACRYGIWIMKETGNNLLIGRFELNNNTECVVGGAYIILNQ